MTSSPRVSHGYTSVGDVRLHHLDYGGDGASILCLHGVTGHAWTWSAVAVRLTPVGSVRALDLRGHGDSQWSASGAYGTAYHVADIDGWIRANRLDQVVLVGFSWGALIALSLAARHPEAVKGVVILDVEPSFEAGVDDVPPLTRSHRSRAAAASAERLANPHAPDETIALAVDMGYRWGPTEEIRPKHDPYFFEHWPFREDDHWGELESLSLPALFVHAGDSFVRRAVMERMASLVPKSKFAEVQDCGHVMPVENPAGVVAAVMPFLENVVG